MAGRVRVRRLTRLFGGSGSNRPPFDSTRLQFDSTRLISGLLDGRRGGSLTRLAATAVLAGMAGRFRVRMLTRLVDGSGSNRPQLDLFGYSQRFISGWHGGFPSLFHNLHGYKLPDVFTPSDIRSVRCAALSVSW